MMIVLNLKISASKTVNDINKSSSDGSTNILGSVAKRSVSKTTKRTKKAKTVDNKDTAVINRPISVESPVIEEVTPTSEVEYTEIHVKVFPIVTEITTEITLEPPVKEEITKEEKVEQLEIHESAEHLDNEEDKVNDDYVETIPTLEENKSDDIVSNEDEVLEVSKEQDTTEPEDLPETKKSKFSLKKIFSFLKRKK